MMRRFENSDEKKFWQVELTGAEALIEWGKIGGSGKQRSHKKFADDSVAASEIAKLVAKKEKEGFVAVGSAAPAAPKPAEAPIAAVPKPAPAPAPPPPPVPSDLVIHPPPDWDTSPLLENVVETAQIATKTALAAVKKQIDETKEFDGTTRRDALMNGLSHMNQALRPRVEEVFATYLAGVMPAKGSTEADAMFLALDTPGQETTSLIVDRVGLVGLAEAMVAALPYVLSRVGGQGASYAFVDKAAGSLTYVSSNVARAAELLRARIATASEADREGVRRVLEAARATLAAPEDFTWRMSVSKAMNDRAWDREIILQGIDKNAVTTWRTGEELIALTGEIDLLEKLAKRFPNNVADVWMLRKYGLPVINVLFIVHDANPARVGALTCIEGVAVAKQLAKSLSNKSAAPEVKAYYEKYPAIAVAALEPIVKADAKLATFARPVLDALLRAHSMLGSEENRPKLSKVASADRIPKVLLTPPTLKKSVTLPAWVEGLPQLLLPDGGALPEGAIQNLLLVLHQSTAAAPHASLAEIKRACDAKSLAHFAWTLFEHWLTESASSKEGWAFTALAHLGGDEEARKLAPLVRAWPGESQHARAVTGLDVLGGIGTDVALMHLHGIAQKVKFKGLQEKAKLKMDALAKARGLTADELADRLVPDLGLDDTGSLVLDFGPRQFTVSFDEELKPFVLDGSKTRIADLPKPNKSDDPEKSKEAVERYKTLKKDAKAVASGQIVRLENAMCAQRRWKAQDFRLFIVEHPLVVHLARRIVFGTYDGDKLGKTTFRVAEDRSFVSADDDEVKLADDAIIGVVHRLEAGDKVFGDWGDHFGRYEVLQPFDQVGRALFPIEEKEKTSKTLDRIKGMKVKTGKVLGLEVRGWRKGAAQDAGWVWDMEKRIGEYVLTLPLGGGIAMGWSEGTPSEQELGAVVIEKRSGDGHASFGLLTPVVFSEVVRELTHLEEA